MTSATAHAEHGPGASTGDCTVLTWWERVTISSAYAAVAFLLHCLSLPGLYRFGRAFGTLEWLIDFRRRRRFTTALESVYGNRPASAVRRRITCEHFMQTRCDKLFYLVFDRIPRGPAAGLFTIRNKELLDDAVQRGCGVYLALSHHGPHHVAGMLVALHGYRAAGVRDGKEGALRRWVQDRFDRRHPDFHRLRVIFADRFPRAIYRCLNEGYILGSAMDVSRLPRANQRAVEVTVLGEPRRFLSGPLRLAMRCGAPVLQAFIVPERNFHYRLDVVEALIDRPSQAGDEDAVVAAAMARYAANVEIHVRNHPALMTRV